MMRIAWFINSKVTRSQYINVVAITVIIIETNLRPLYSICHVTVLSFCQGIDRIDNSNPLVRAKIYVSVYE